MNIYAEEMINVISEKFVYEVFWKQCDPTARDQKNISGWCLHLF